MAAAPLISVVMPVYNRERYLKEAIESILAQTFRDFEFIIINDGSTDSTGAILSHYQRMDDRIRVYHQENQGLITSLNRGCRLAQGKYISRMDGDDISLPERLRRQADYLDAHPEIGIVGSSCWLIDAYGHRYGICHVPKSDLEIRWRSLLASPFAHPTVMMRRDILVRYGLIYDDSWLAVEDYDLWTRMLRYTQGVNFIEPLLYYRVHSGETHKHREIQLKNHDRIALRTIQEQLPEFHIDIEQVSQLRALFVGGREFTLVPDSQRVALASLYLDMFENFVSRYPIELSLEAMQHKEVLKLAHILLHIPIQSRSAGLVKRLLTMYPGLPWSLAVQLLKASFRSFRRLLGVSAHQYRHQVDHWNCKDAHS